MKETIAYLNSLLKDNDTVIIGLSGGPDSMCLLNILLSLKKDLKIICAHINHNIRKESIEELEFIENYCKEKNIILETTTFDKKSSETDYNELELREKRYTYFKEIINKYKAQYLFTAHHGDDLIETILMRLTRGSNLKGYSGFQVETNKNNYKIIKPLIFMTKEEINSYNKENNIPFVIDKTNEEDNYTRNRYRHHILPFLKSENKNVHLKYLKFSKELQSYYEFVDKTVKQEIDKRYIKNILDIEDFERLDALIQTRVIEYILDQQYVDNLYLVSDRHINLILDIIKNTESNSNYYIRLNSKEITLPLYVRTRKEGDKMFVKNM